MTYLYIYLLICIVLGVVTCFYGKKLVYLIFSICAFGIGFIVCVDNIGSDSTGIIIAMVVGVICVLLLRFFYRAGLFVLGGVVGYLLGTLLLGIAPNSLEQYQWVILFVCIVGMGFSMAKWFEFLVVVVTSFLGGFIVVSTACFTVMNFGNLVAYIYADGSLTTIAQLSKYLFGDFAYEFATPILFGTIIFAVIGTISQKKRG